jgi:hypothetical protein
VDEQETDRFIEDIAAELRRPVRLDARFDARVMAALEPQVIPLREREPRPRARVLGWLRRPHTVSVSPLGALAGVAVAAGLAAIAVVGARRGSSFGDTASSSIGVTSPLQPVVNGRILYSQTFVFYAPSATSVTLVGDFNDWDTRALPLERASADGLWSVTVPLPAGRHEYQFVVDGTEWKQDPAAELAVEDDFGLQNSVVTVNGGGR